MVNKLKSFIYNIFFRKKNSKQKILFYTKDIFRDKKYQIGDFTYGNPEVLFETDEATLIIGKYTSIADNVKIFLGGNHRHDWVSTYPFNVLNEDFSSIKGHPSTKGSVLIGNDVWIGHSTVILSGVVISDGAVIGANSVVTKNIGPYEIWAGNPAKFIKKRFSENQIKDLLNIKWWEFDEIQLKKVIPYLCSDNINDFIENNKS